MIYNKYGDEYYRQRERFSFTKDIDLVKMSDISRRKSDKIGVYGVSPLYSETMEGVSLEIAEARPNTRWPLSLFWDYVGGLSLGEQLYSAAGSQSAGISEYYRKYMNLDPNSKDSRFLIDVFSKRWGNQFFELRPAFSLSRFGLFEFKESFVLQNHDVIVSIPLYCKMAGISISEIDYEDIRIRLKPEYNTKEFILQFREDFNRVLDENKRRVPPDDQTYANYLVVESWKQFAEGHFMERAEKLASLFSQITVIAMGLCFFSLSSSMSANISDQCKEIQVLRSFGTSKFFIMRTFVYEALILVMSSATSGLFIGVFVGNLMSVQQSMIMSFPYEISLPLEQFKFVVVVSFVCAVASTFNTAHSILSKSIPDISRQ